jgi:hypothetical protein
MADWKQIGGQAIAAGAPILGKIIGEFIPFPGGGMLAEWGIKKIAEALGVPEAEATPDRLANAAQNLPAGELERRLAPIEAEADEKWKAYARAAEAVADVQKANVTAIGETQRAEAAQGVRWWHWRHLIGYVTMAQGAVFVVGSAKIMFLGGDIAALAALVTAITPIFLGLAALNGYVAADTTALRVAAITGQPQQGVVASAIDAVKPKKK